jgi:energy-coupling factor transporter transmembrane protein EcfT
VKALKHWLASCIALLAALFAPAAAFAQGCALCYTQAAGSGARMIAALRSGILILVVPPMLICIGITWMAYKKRNQFNEDLTSEPYDYGSNSDNPRFELSVPS